MCVGMCVLYVCEYLCVFVCVCICVCNVMCVCVCVCVCVCDYCSFCRSGEHYLYYSIKNSFLPSVCPECGWQV